jgi:hypothetical protein
MPSSYLDLEFFKKDYFFNSKKLQVTNAGYIKGDKLERYCLMEL